MKIKTFLIIGLIVFSIVYSFAYFMGELSTVQTNVHKILVNK